MRGRTLNHSFVILDEAQNTTPEADENVPHASARLKAVVTGDITRSTWRVGRRAAWWQSRNTRSGRGIAFTAFRARTSFAILWCRASWMPTSVTGRVTALAGPLLVRRRTASTTASPANASPRAPSSGRLSRHPGPGLGPSPPLGALGAQRFAEITVRIVGAAEARLLNRRYRGRDYAPNVLSFPMRCEAAWCRAICPFAPRDRARSARSGNPWMRISSI